MVDPEIRKIIFRFVAVLVKKGIQVKKVVLYGSYASGKVHAGSDLDLAIISPDFGKIGLKKEKCLCRQHGE